MYTKTKHHHPTVAFVIDSLFDDYQITLWESIRSACRSYSINFISFQGGIMGTEHYFQSSRNKIYDIISSKYIDGIIFTSNAFFYNTTADEMEIFFNKKFGTIPLVSVGTKLKEIPSVVIDNKQGMKQLLRHLIKDHGYMRIAFIKGLEMNTDAQERFTAYKEVLAENDILFDNNLVLNGEFTIESGRKAIEELIVIRKEKCEAIVAANDLMAVSAMSELIQRGIEVPSEIAVTGFDNNPILYGYYPPLTTISQPVAEIGQYAVKIIADIMAGRQVPSVKVLPTFPVIRSSCGCMMHFMDKKEILKTDENDYYLKNDSNSKEDNYKIIDFDTLDDLFILLKEEIKQSIQDLSPSIESPFMDKVIRHILSNKMGINNYFIKVANLFGSLKHSLDNCYLDTIEQLEKDSIYVFIAVDAFLQTGKQMELVKEKAAIYRFVQRLSTSISEEYLLKALEEELPSVGIRNFFIFNEYSIGQITKARLDFSLSLDDIFKVDEKIKEFSADELFPGTINDEDSTFEIVVYPLYFKTENIGYYICTVGSNNTIIYEMLHGQVSGALKSMQMIKQLKKHTQSLEKMVNERTKELRRMTINLKKVNKKLEELSVTDELTSTFNRRFYNEQITREWNRSLRDLSTLSLLLIDIDFFKKINDTYGHQVGDKCLIEISYIIKKYAQRSTDTVCRYGGEEFAVILPMTKLDDAVIIAEEIRKAVEKICVNNYKKVIQFTVSIGVCSIIPKRENIPSILITLADKALYEAKNSGRNRVCVHDKLM